MAEWSGEPAYKQLAEDLRSSIADGRLPVGSKLPSISDLMHQYDVSITVVRMALSALRSEGLIESHQGKGAFVLSRTASGGTTTGRSAEYAEIIKHLDAVQERLERLDDRISRLEKASRGRAGGA
jgi:DNA-binding GntR family transcriptional regulator